MNNINSENYHVRYSNIKDKINSILSLQIRTMRHKRNLTQKELAKRIGMRQVNISLLERHRREPGFKIDTLACLAAAFDVGIRVEFVAVSEMEAWTKKLLQRVTHRDFDVTPIECDIPPVQLLSTGFSRMTEKIPVQSNCSSLPSMEI